MNLNGEWFKLRIGNNRKVEAVIENDKVEMRRLSNGVGRVLKRDHILLTV